MRDLPVAAIADGSRCKQRGRLAGTDARQELGEPLGEQRRMGTRHAHRLNQCRRKKLVAARLPRLAIAVVAEPMKSTRPNLFGKYRVEGLGPFEREDQGEACVEMGSDPDRVRHDVEIGAKALRKDGRQRLQLIAPAFVVPGRLEMKLEQPGPTVRPLEASARGPVEIGKLGAHLLGRETAVRQLGDRRRFIHLREQSSKREQGPPAVDAAVPVEAAKEDRVKRAGRQSIRVTVQHMIELVRIFLGHMAEGDCRHPRGEPGIEPSHRRKPAK